MVLNSDFHMRSREQSVKKSRGGDATSLAALFLSGFAVLMYQLCWIRKATRVFGSTIYATRAALAAFSLGFSIGGFLCGRLAQLATRSLRLFEVTGGPAHQPVTDVLLLLPAIHWRLQCSIDFSGAYMSASGTLHAG